MYKLKRFISFPGRLFSELVWAWQRAVRGFSDRDWWSIDYHLAHILSKALPMYVEKGHGISASYIDSAVDPEDEEAWEVEIKKAEAKRDEEYLKYADFFTRYCDGGIWNDEKDAKELNGVTQKEYEEAMKWLSENFASLWD